MRVSRPHVDACPNLDSKGDSGKYAEVYSDSAEYITCVELAMDALEDRRLTPRALSRLSMFGLRGTPEQQEHIARLIERIAP